MPVSDDSLRMSYNGPYKPESDNLLRISFELLSFSKTGLLDLDSKTLTNIIDRIEWDNNQHDLIIFFFISSLDEISSKDLETLLHNGIYSAPYDRQTIFKYDLMSVDKKKGISYTIRARDRGQSFTIKNNDFLGISLELRLTSCDIETTLINN